MSVFEDQDIVQQTMLHLQPRHVYKLMQTSKSVNSKVQAHAYYFERVAVHSLYVGEEGLKTPGSYSRMKSTPHGYNAAMNDFVRLTQAFLLKHGVVTTTPLEMVQKYNEFTEAVPYEAYPLEFELTPLNVNKYCAKSARDDREGNELETLMFHMSNELEDMAIPVETKRSVAQKIKQCFCVPRDALHAAISDLPAFTVNDNFMVQMSIGFFRLSLEYCRFHTTFNTRAEDWTKFMQTVTLVDSETHARFTQDIVASCKFAKEFDAKMLGDATTELDVIWELGDFVRDCDNAMRCFSGNAAPE